jgi:hypothetical protein
LTSHLERIVVSEKMIEDDLNHVKESATKSTYKLGVGFERCEDKGVKSAPKFVPSSSYHKEEETLKSTKAHYPSNPKPSFNPKREVRKETSKPRDEAFMSYLISKRVEPKPPYVCPGRSNHTYSNNMIIRWNVQLQQSNICYIMTRRSQKDYRAANSRYTKRSVASTVLTVREAHLALFTFALLEFLVPTSHASKAMMQARPSRHMVATQQVREK